MFSWGRRNSPHRGNPKLQLPQGLKASRSLDSINLGISSRHQSSIDSLITRRCIRSETKDNVNPANKSLLAKYSYGECATEKQCFLCRFIVAN